MPEGLAGEARSPFQAGHSSPRHQRSRRHDTLPHFLAIIAGGGAPPSPSIVEAILPSAGLMHSERIGSSAASLWIHVTS